MNWICCCQTISHMSKVIAVCRTMDLKSFCNMGYPPPPPPPPKLMRISKLVKSRSTNTQLVCPIILHRARQYHCRAQCKISKRLVKWGNSCRNPDLKDLILGWVLEECHVLHNHLIPYSKRWNFLRRIYKRSFKSAFIRRHKSHINLFIMIESYLISDKLQFHRLFHIGELTQN